MKYAGIIVAATAAFLLAGQAEALPVTPAVATGNASVVLVRGGCGFGAHRGYYGGCRLNRGPRGALRQAITGAPRGCPPGLYRGPYGRCRPR